MRPIHAADLFCGAGGTSTGLALACEELGLKVDLIALNHWGRILSRGGMRTKTRTSSSS